MIMMLAGLVFVMVILLTIMESVAKPYDVLEWMILGGLGFILLLCLSAAIYICLVEFHVIQYRLF